jgi:hypothetical protein
MSFLSRLFSNVKNEDENNKDLGEDPLTLYEVSEDQRLDHDPKPGDEGYPDHIAGEDEELVDVPEGSEDEIEYFGDDDDFDESALMDEGEEE